jgi:hypothetical protein
VERGHTKFLFIVITILEQGEAYKGFPHTYWAFTKGTLTQTLTLMGVEEDEQSAIQIFGLILTYAGLMVVATSSKEEGGAALGGGVAAVAVKKVINFYLLIIFVSTGSRILFRSRTFLYESGSVGRKFWSRIWHRLIGYLLMNL